MTAIVVAHLSRAGKGVYGSYLASLVDIIGNTVVIILILLVVCMIDLFRAVHLSNLKKGFKKTLRVRYWRKKKKILQAKRMTNEWQILLYLLRCCGFIWSLVEGSMEIEAKYPFSNI